MWKWIIFLSLSFSLKVHCLCGSNIRWSHNVNMDYVYGIWYGVGYAQHSMDMSDIPDEIGCVTLYITDATVEENDWLDWNFPRPNYTDNWKPYKSNLRAYTSTSGWLDGRVRKRAKRNMYEERRVKVVWDEDGQTLERVYLYTVEDPGLWIAEKQWRPMEKMMISRGIDVWYPDDPPYHPDVIRVLKATPDTFTINRCSEVGLSSIITLILKRSQETVSRRHWYELKSQLYDFDLPNIRRYAAVCGACRERSLVIFVIVALVLGQIYLQS